MNAVYQYRKGSTVLVHAPHPLTSAWDANATFFSLSIDSPGEDVSEETCKNDVRSCSVLTELLQKSRLVLAKFLKKYESSPSFAASAGDADLVSLWGETAPLTPMAVISAVLALPPLIQVVHVAPPAESGVQTPGSIHYMYEACSQVEENPMRHGKSRLWNNYVAATSAVVFDADNESGSLTESKYSLHAYMSRGANSMDAVDDATRRYSSVSWSEETIWRLLNSLLSAAAVVHSAGFTFGGVLSPHDVVAFAVPPSLSAAMDDTRHSVEETRGAWTRSHVPLLVKMFHESIILPEAFVTADTAPHHVYFCITRLPTLESDADSGGVEAVVRRQQQDVANIGTLVLDIVERQNRLFPDHAVSSELLFLLKRIAALPTEDVASAPTALNIIQLQAFQLRASNWLYRTVAELLLLERGRIRPNPDAENTNGGSRQVSPRKYASREQESESAKQQQRQLAAKEKELAERERLLTEREAKMDAFLELYELTHQYLDAMPAVSAATATESGYEYLRRQLQQPSWEPAPEQRPHAPDPTPQPARPSHVDPSHTDRKDAALHVAPAVERPPAPPPPPSPESAQPHLPQPQISVAPVILPYEVVEKPSPAPSHSEAEIEVTLVDVEPPQAYAELQLPAPHRQIGYGDDVGARGNDYMPYSSPHYSYPTSVMPAPSSAVLAMLNSTPVRGEGERSTHPDDGGSSAGGSASRPEAAAHAAAAPVSRSLSYEPSPFATPLPRSAPVATAASPSSGCSAGGGSGWRDLDAVRSSPSSYIDNRGARGAAAAVREQQIPGAASSEKRRRKGYTDDSWILQQQQTLASLQEDLWRPTNTTGIRSPTASESTTPRRRSERHGGGRRSSSGSTPFQPAGGAAAVAGASPSPSSFSPTPVQQHRAAASRPDDASGARLSTPPSSSSPRATPFSSANRSWGGGGGGVPHAYYPEHPHYVGNGGGGMRGGGGGGGGGTAADGPTVQLTAAGDLSGGYPASHSFSPSYSHYHHHQQQQQQRSPPGKAARRADASNAPSALSNLSHNHNGHLAPSATGAAGAGGKARQSHGAASGSPWRPMATPLSSSSPAAAGASPNVSDVSARELLNRLRSSKTW